MKTNSKGFIHILLILVVVAIIAGVYFVGTQKGNLNSIVSVGTPIPTQTSISVSDWKTDLKLNVPSNWTVDAWMISEFPLIYNKEGELDNNKTYNSIEIRKETQKMYAGYSNSNWFSKINELTAPFIDQRTMWTKINSGVLSSGQNYVIFTTECSPTAQTECVKLYNAYILKEETIYMLILSSYNEMGVKTFENLVTTAQILD